MADLSKIIEGLSEAQRRAILHAPDDCIWMGGANIKGFKQSFAAMDRPGLGRPQLCEVRCDIGGIRDARLTPLGLAIRAELQRREGK